MDFETAQAIVQQFGADHPEYDEALDVVADHLGMDHILMAETDIMEGQGDGYHVSQ